MSSRELEYLYGLTFSSNGTHDQNEDGLHMHGSLWVSHARVPINPANKIYYYDFVMSCAAGNQVYVGWEKYDADNTPRANNACVYVHARKFDTDISYMRFQGTVNLATDGYNPTAEIKLRILNKWTGSTTDTTGEAIIHSLSLREVTSGETFGKQSITKTGLMTADIFREGELGSSISKNGFIDAKRLIEF